MYLPHLPLALMGNFLGVDDLVIPSVIGLLFFGRKLPEVGKNLGRTIVEFKKGLNSGSEGGETNPYTETEEVERPAPPKRIVGTNRVQAAPPARKAASGNREEV